MHRRVLFNGLVACTTLAAIVLVAYPVGAQSWDTSASILAAATVSDNGGLTSTGSQNTATSFELTPSFGVSRTGPRWTLTSNYRLQMRFYESDTIGDRAFHNLNLNSQFMVIEDVAGVLFNSTISQQTIDPLEPVGLTTATGQRNLSESNTYAIEPFINFSLGSFTAGRLSYRAGLVEYDAPQLPDSKSGRALASVTTNPAGAAWSFTAFLSQNDLEYDSGREITLSRASVDTAYQVTPRAQLVLNVGVDDNDVGDLPFTNDVDGTFWLAGVRGSFNEFSNYEARVGRQFYGDSYQLHYDRQRGRVAVGLDYNESTSTRGGSQLDYEAILNYVSDIVGIELPGVTQDVYVQKRFSVNGSYTLAKSSWRLTVFNENREYVTNLDGDLEDSILGFGLNWSWAATSRTNVEAALNWQRFEPRDEDSNPRDLRMSVSWRRALFTSSYVSLRLMHNQRESRRGRPTYEENVLTLGIGHEF